MRLDAYLFEKKLYPSRTKAAEAIERGSVFVNGKRVEKTAFKTSDLDKIEVIPEGVEFVTNGGYKLEKALDDFAISPNGLTFADVGASAGGFTDCLLKRGAKKVFAIDVGESLLNEGLKNDERVVVVDNFNARNLSADALGEKTDGVVCDVSFISLTYVLKPIYDALKDDGFAIVLIKPQFESGKKQLNKNGIATLKSTRLSAVQKVVEFAKAVGFSIANFSNAPVREGKNIEFLLYLTKNDKQSISDEDIKNRVI